MRIVVFEVAIDTKASTQWTGEQATTGSGTDEGELIKIYLNGTRRWTFVYHDVDAIILHGGIEIFLHDWRETMNLINE